MAPCFALPPSDAELLKEYWHRLMMSHAAMLAFFRLIAPTTSKVACEMFLMNLLAFAIDDACRDHEGRKLGFERTQARILRALKLASQQGGGALPLGGRGLNALNRSFCSVADEALRPLPRKKGKGKK